MKLVSFVLRLGVGVTAMAMPSCASEPKHIFTYGSSEDAAASIPSPAPESPESIASALRDDLECSREVRRLATQRAEEDRAWDLLRACLAMDKFRDLKLALSPPLLRRSQLLGNIEQARLFAQLVATRGANFRRDLRLLEAEGVAIHSLEEVFNKPERHRGALVTFHAVMVPEGSSPSRVQLAEVDKLTADLYAPRHSDRAEGSVQSQAGRSSNPVDRYGREWVKAGSQNFGHFTGRQAIGSVDSKLRRRLSAANEYVVVGVLQSVRGFVKDGEPRQEARLKLIDAFPPGVETPEF